MNRPVLSTAARRLINIGLALQFYVPATVCVALIAMTCLTRSLSEGEFDKSVSSGKYPLIHAVVTSLPKPLWSTGEDPDMRLTSRKALLSWTFLTALLMLFVYNLVTWKWNYHADGWRDALRFLIVFNCIHAGFWLCFLSPFTALRLSIPTLLYYRALQMPLVDASRPDSIP